MMHKYSRTRLCRCMQDERFIKYVKNLISVRAAGEHCVFATRSEDNPAEWVLILCNAIGTPVDRCGDRQEVLENAQ